MLLISLALSFPASPRVAGATTPPSIVLIVTDDQRWNTLWAMPTVQSELVGHGVRFKNGFVVNSLCCPSRASILTGRYSHGTNVYRNGMVPYGYQDFDEGSTVATWLQAAGYRTGLVGKYLGGYSEDLVAHIPAGWDRWFAFVSPDAGNGDYYDYSVSDDGVLASYGDAPQDYSTDVFASKAVSFIDETPLGQPLFLYFAPRAPHAPATPATRHADAFSGLSPLRPPSYNEVDVSDKPTYVASRRLLTDQESADMDQLRIDGYRTLLAVDEAIADIVDALDRAGRLSTTLIAFISDNGYLLGEHREDGKKFPYEEAIRVPLVVRYDPMTTTPRSDGHLALNIDLAPTFAALAGVGPTVDGRSLLPLLVSKQAPWRQDFLIENSQAADHIPKFCAVRTRRYLYVDYGTSEQELYDIKIDPFQLENLAGDPAQQMLLVSLNARMRALCSPPPPGFVPDDLSGVLGPT
jgi:arylsulfatase A-like enzyme